jgi:hypothetical protein
VNRTDRDSSAGLRRCRSRAPRPRRARGQIQRLLLSERTKTTVANPSACRRPVRPLPSPGTPTRRRPPVDRAPATPASWPPLPSRGFSCEGGRARIAGCMAPGRFSCRGRPRTCPILGARLRTCGRQARRPRRRSPPAEFLEDAAKILREADTVRPVPYEHWLRTFGEARHRCPSPREEASLKSGAGPSGVSGAGRKLVKHAPQRSATQPPAEHRVLGRRSLLVLGSGCRFAGQKKEGWPRRATPFGVPCGRVLVTPLRGSQST